MESRDDEEEEQLATEATSSRCCGRGLLTHFCKFLTLLSHVGLWLLRSARTVGRIYALFLDTPRLRREFRGLVVDFFRFYAPGLAAGVIFGNFHTIWTLLDARLQ